MSQLGQVNEPYNYFDHNAMQQMLFNAGVIPAEQNGGGAWYKNFDGAFNAENIDKNWRPYLQTGGGLLGGLLGAGAGGGIGSIATGSLGAGLGYAAGDNVADLLAYAAGKPQQSKGLLQSIGDTVMNAGSETMADAMANMMTPIAMKPFAAAAPFVVGSLKLPLKKTFSWMKGDISDEVADIIARIEKENNAWARFFEDYSKGNISYDKGKFMRLGETPEVYRMLGYDNLPFSIYPQKTKLISQKHPDVDTDVIKNAPLLAADPIAVMKSKTDPYGSVVSIVNALDMKDNPIFAAITMNDKGLRNVFSNRIASIYGKENLANYIANANGTVKYVNRVLANELFNPMGMKAWDNGRFDDITRVIMKKGDGKIMTEQNLLDFLEKKKGL